MSISNLKMRNHDIRSPVPVAESKSTIGVNYNVYVLARTWDED